MEFTQEQITYIREQAVVSFNHPKLQGIQNENLGVSFSCAACMVGLNIVAAAGVGVVIAAGIAVAPEAAICVTIAGFFAAEAITAAAVATVLNTIIAAGAGATVEMALEALCEAFGAC